MSKQHHGDGDPIVETQGLTKIYQQGELEVRALHDVDLQVHAGEFVALAGPSGSGKTTLLNLIGALDTPTRGSLAVEGRQLAELGGKALAQLRLRRFGFVFQSYNLIPVLSAAENAEYVLLLQGMGADERRQKVRSVLAAVGLAGLEDRRPSQLSGGQQQRVAVARAIAAEPALVLADEPTANLDSQTGNELVDLMRELNEERDITFIISSHDRKVIDRAKRVVQLVDGAIVDNGNGNDVAGAVADA